MDLWSAASGIRYVRSLVGCTCMDTLWHGMGIGMGMGMRIGMEMRWREQERRATTPTMFLVVYHKYVDCTRAFLRILYLTRWRRAI